MTVPINCFDCGHRHELQDHVYNNLLWDNQDVFCGKCGKKLRAGIQPKKTPIIPTNEKKEVEAVEDVNLEATDQKNQTSTEGGGTLLFCLWYVGFTAMATYTWGTAGLAFCLTPFLLFGIMYLLHKWGERL